MSRLSSVLWSVGPVLAFCVACESADKAGPVVDVGALDDSVAADADGDGFPGDEDCNDADASVSPASVEICDGVDNDCDGFVDEDVLQAFYADTDGDGFGDPTAVEEACAQPADTVPNSNDCDDGSAAIYPGAPEVCNGVDDDCSGVVDDGLVGTFYPDADADGWGDAEGEVSGCDPGAGWVEVAGDCDDDAPETFPGNTERCDGVDNNCDGAVDEGLLRTFYIDLDADGWGNAGSVVEACDEPSGYAGTAGDCDDGNAEIRPDATEVCNGVDDDCDGDIDDADGSVVGLSVWYPDLDGDGFGDPDAGLSACEAPSSYGSDDQDCDDSDALVSPDAAEICNSIDDDCDGDIDDDDADLTGATDWYVDADADGFGGSSSVSACVAPSGTVSVGSDCDDTDPLAYPGATETCDGVDEDCDGTVDNGVLGTGAACPADDCAAILVDNPTAADGSYTLVPGTYTCDMTTDGGGWTLVGASAYVYGTGASGVEYNTEGFTWSQALFTYASGSVHAHCSYPSGLTSCNNIGMKFATEAWGVALNWGSSLCSMATTSYTAATTYIGGYDWIIDRAVSTDTIQVATLEGAAACTTSDNPGGAYIDIWVRD